jgi:hypothetical protein
MSKIKIKNKKLISLLACIIKEGLKAFGWVK